MATSADGRGIDVAEAERQEFRRLLVLARQRGWRVPEPHGDSHGPRAWMGYWRAMEQVQREREAGNPDPGRPILPHTPGFRGSIPETETEEAERLIRNSKRWEGWL